MLKRHLKSLLRVFPPTQQLLDKIQHRRRFQTELKLIRGEHETPNTHPSIIHFSFNKAATQYVKSILERCAAENGMVPVNLHGYAFHTDFPYLASLSREAMAEYQHVFKKCGYLYSVFGGMINGIQGLEDYQVVLVVRDPRDLLVSSYFSIAYSHKTPAATGDKHPSFLKKRTKVRAIPIDDYVRSESDRLYRNFQRYQTLLLDQYDTPYVTTYEAMVTDFEGWLNALLNYCDLAVSEPLRQSLLTENVRMKPKAEDIYRHIRKGRPGDHREKLKPDTIAFLNEKFAPFLERFQYPL